jgi:hypothetical protein
MLAGGIAFLSPGKLGGVLQCLLDTICGGPSTDGSKTFKVMFLVVYCPSMLHFRKTSMDILIETCIFGETW